MQVPKLLSDAKAERVVLEQKRAAVAQPAGTGSDPASGASIHAGAGAPGAGAQQPSASQPPNISASAAAGQPPPANPASSSDAVGKLPLLYQLQLQGDKEKEVSLLWHDCCAAFEFTLTGVKTDRPTPVCRHWSPSSWL
jgi:hypothetical protein